MAMSEEEMEDAIDLLDRVCEDLCDLSSLLTKHGVPHELDDAHLVANAVLTKLQGDAGD